MLSGPKPTGMLSLRPSLEESDIRERRRRIRQSRGALDELGRAEDRRRDLWIQIGDEPQPDEATPNSGVTQLLTGLLGILGVGVLVAGILVSIALSPAGRERPGRDRRGAVYDGRVSVLQKPFVKQVHGIAVVGADPAADQRG